MNFLLSSFSLYSVSLICVLMEETALVMRDFKEWASSGVKSGASRVSNSVAVFSKCLHH